MLENTTFLGHGTKDFVIKGIQVSAELTKGDWSLVFMCWWRPYPTRIYVIGCYLNQSVYVKVCNLHNTLNQLMDIFSMMLFIYFWHPGNISLLLYIFLALYIFIKLSSDFINIS